MNNNDIHYGSQLEICTIGMHAALSCTCTMHQATPARDARDVNEDVPTALQAPGCLVGMCLVAEHHPRAARSPSQYDKAAPVA